jgi:hypothetical protein
MMLFGRCYEFYGSLRKAAVEVYGGDVLVLHAELSTGSDVETEEGQGRTFPWKEPVVGFEDNQRKAADGRTVTLKETFFAPFDIDFEKKGNVKALGLGGEQGSYRQHSDLRARSAWCGSIRHGPPAKVTQMAEPVCTAYSCLPEIDIQTRTVHLQQCEVIRSGLDG